MAGGSCVWPGTITDVKTGGGTPGRRLGGTSRSLASGRKRVENVLDSRTGWDRRAMCDVFDDVVPAASHAGRHKLIKRDIQK